MPTFVWEGRTRTGEVRKGVAEAENDNELMSSLRAQNISVTSVRRRSKEISLNIGTGVKQKDLVIFTRQFSTMIDAGLPLVQALDILGKQSDNKRFGKIILDIKRRVEGGATFSQALHGHPKVFDDLFVNLVAAGEVAGILDTIMSRLAVYIEKAMKLKAKVKGAMIYPSIVAIVAITVIAVLLGKVIPVFQDMFKDMGAGKLPALTQFVINVSEGFVHNAHIFGLFTLVLVVGFVVVHRNRNGRKMIHAGLLRMPAVGTVLRKTAVARFTRTFGTLISSGVPILDALEIVARTAGNLVIEDALMEVRQRVSEGKDLATPLMQTGVFPPMVVQMIGVGEQTGAMDQMLQKIADFYEDEVDAAVAGLTAMLEPLMIVVLGGIVGVIMIAMYQPIFEIAGSIRG